jgi:hypothetical protein
MRKIKDYIILDVPFGRGYATHSFYLKEHTDNKANKGNGRTLFVGNVDYRVGLSPAEIDEMFHGMFGIFGPIESISLSDLSSFKNQSTSYPERLARFANVVFKSASSLKEILSESSLLAHEEMKKYFASESGVTSDAPFGHFGNEFRYSYGNI